MSTIPKHWGTKKLADVCDNLSLNNIKIKQRDYLLEGEFPIVDQGQDLVGGYYNDESFVVPLEPPYIIFGDHTKVKKFVNFKFVAGADGVKVLKPKETIDPKFLFYLISNAQIEDKGYARHFQFLAKIDLPIPSLPEQKIIVSKIEELLSDLENGKQQLLTAREQLKVYRQSLLKWAFEGKLTENWRKQNLQAVEGSNSPNAQKGSKGKSTSKVHGSRLRTPTESQTIAAEPEVGYVPQEGIELGELPEGWKWVKLRDLASKVTDGEHITPKRTSTGYYLLSARNIQNGYLALEYVDYVPEDEYQRIRKRCNPEPGDILISCSGSIGRVCRVPEKLPFVMVRSVAMVKLDWTKTSSKFYEYLFQSPLLQKQIEKGKKATAQANLFLGPIKNLDVLVCSIKEQQAIVEELESKLTVCDKIEETIESSLQQAETLKQSILKQAFEGRLV